MHEVGIAAGILDAVRAETAPRKPARAVKVGVRIGEDPVPALLLSGVLGLRRERERTEKKSRPEA